MKKLSIYLLLVVGMIMATQTVNAQFVKVRNPFVAGTVINTTGTPLCNGLIANLTCSPATGGDTIGGYTYQWQSSPNNTTWTNVGTYNSLTYTTPQLTDTMYYHVIIGNLCTPVITSNVVQINTYDPFIFAGGITTISGGGSSICYNTSTGTMTAPTVTGGAPGTTTQWQSSPDGLAPWTDISGANALTYTNLNLTSTTHYRVQFTNTCNVLTSTVKIIIVYNNFVFVGGVTTISGGIDPSCYNTSAGTMTAPTVTGGALGTTIQWQSSPDGLTNWIPASGTNNTSMYTTPNLTSTTHYRVQFTNTCNVLTSTVKIIIVYNNFVFVGGNTIIGGNTPLCNNLSAGTMTAPTVTGGAPGTTTQWQSSLDGLTNWIPASGSNNTSMYTTPNLTSTTYYRVQFTNTCNVLTSTVKTINVWAPFNPGVVTTDSITICYGTAPPAFVNLVSPSGGDGVYTFNWLESSINAAPWNPATGINNSQNYQPPTLYNQMGYRRNVTNTCGSGHSTAQ